MKNIKIFVGTSILFILTACSTSSKFPVSSTTPAADITAKKGMDKQNNYTLEITAENLATADRLNPAGHNYSVWIVTKDNVVKNVGQLNVENAKKTTFKTTTAFDFNQVFITVENQGDLNYPKGVEISRTKIN
jgi:hypothetical protein